MSKFGMQFLIGTLIITFIIAPAVVIGLYMMGVLNFNNTIAKPDNITINHIDKDGTIWVGVDGNLYYLYLSDNGTQKKLEMK